MAKSEFNPNNILQLLKDSDGSGSLLDADMLDGLDSTSFLEEMLQMNLLKIMFLILDQQIINGIQYMHQIL